MHRASVSADPRRRAVEVLARVESAGSHAARLLGDAAPLQRELVLGVLRWQLTLDAILDRHARKPLTELDAPVRACLRSGLYEAARLSTPVPVAVAEAVRVAHMLAPRATGLVNAVLRRAAAEPWPDPDDPGLPLSFRFSHPDWLVARWRERLGEVRLREVLEADQSPAAIWLLAGACDLDELRARGCTLEPHPDIPGSVAVRAGVEAAVDALRSGRAYAMDPAAVAVARLLPETDGPLADLAAAPGGKSLVLGLERPRRTRVACDRHLGRCRMLRGNLARTPAPPAIVAADAARPALRPGALAAVLLDAPCTGTGTLRRHPEIRWRLQPSSPAELAEVQRVLAAAAAELLAPGGVLLYATCSLEPEENEEVVAALPLDAVPLAGQLPAGIGAIELASGGVLLPPAPGGDGFVAHLLRRPG